MPLCMGCLNEIFSNDVKCEHCGFDNSQKQVSPYLPYGAVLAGKYVVAKNIDTNGESTRYLGYDNSSGRVVTIREFLPIGLFTRAAGEVRVEVEAEKRMDFSQALSDFESYYKTLTTLQDMSAMVNILDIFNENNTCYIVEKSEELIPFTNYLEHHDGQLDWEDARPLFMPIITLLEALHKNNIGHYAISPSNLFITSDGKLKLSGFSTENERKRGTMLKSQLYTGCAAPEQYKENYQLDVTTDIYGFTATLFYALTGKLPANAKERVKDPKLLISKNTVKRLPPHVVSTLADGLQIRRSQRIKDFDDLRSQLSVSSTVQAIQDEISKTASMTPIKSEDFEKKSKVNPTAVGIVATIVALLIFASVGFYWLSINPLKGLFKNNATIVATAPPTEEEWTGPVFNNYVGLAYEDLIKQAVKDNINIKFAADNEFSDKVEKDTVISQEPAAGTPIVSSNPYMYVVLSKGPELIKLPEANKKSLGNVAEKLTDLGFVVLQEEEYSNSIKDGYVIGYKDHKQGDKVENGSEITIIVSKGKQISNDESQ